MPVNEKNGNEELLEQGWRRMQGLLDLEMPQNRNKKWGLWIPFSVLGAVLIIIALLNFPADNSNETVPVEVPNPHESFAQSDQGGVTNQRAETKESEGGILNGSAESSVEEKPPNGSKDPATLSTAITLPDEQGNTVNSKSKKSVTNSELHPNMQSDFNNNNVGEQKESIAAVKSMTELETVENTDVSRGSEILEPAFGFDSKEEISSEITTRSNNEISAQVQSEGVEGEINSDRDLSIPKVVEVDPINAGDDLHPSSYNDGIDISAQRHIVEQESLAPVSMSILAPEEQSVGLMAKPIIPAATQLKSKVGLEVYVAPHFVSNVELRGIEAGALATVTLGRRWKILGGASYGHYNKSGILPTVGRSQSQDAENFDVPVIADTTLPGYPFVDPQIAYNKIGYDTVQLLTEKFNYLHFPVFAQFRLARFFSLTGGFKISYLLNAPSNKNLSGISPNGSLGGGSLDLNASSNFLDDEDILRKWDVAPMVGIAFDIGRKLSFDIQYQHGLIPYVDRPTENDRSDYHRSVLLGLRYRIL